MKWDEKISDQTNVSATATIDLGYGNYFHIFSGGEETPEFGAVVTKVLESKITLRDARSGKELFSGSLMELCFVRLRSICKGGGS